MLKEKIKEIIDQYILRRENNNDNPTTVINPYFYINQILQTLQESLPEEKEIPHKTGDWNGGDYDYHFGKEIGFNACLSQIKQLLK